MTSPLIPTLPHLLKGTIVSTSDDSFEFEFRMEDDSSSMLLGGYLLAVLQKVPSMDREVSVSAVGSRVSVRYGQADRNIVRDVIRATVDELGAL